VHFLSKYHWILCCYLIGAYIKMYGLFQEKSNLSIVGVIVATTFLGMVSWYIVKYVNFLTNKSITYTLFTKYNSPLVVLNAVGLLCLFSRINMNIGEKGKYVIRKLSEASFSVYIIHSHILVFDYIFKDAFIWISELNVVYSVGSFIFVIIAVYFICFLIDIVRVFLFSMVKVDRIIKWMERYIDKLLLRNT